MKASLAPLGLLLLAACAFAPLRFPVRDVVIPAQSSGGNICYVEVSERPPANFRRVSYEATATYRTDSRGGAALAAPATVVVYGRRSGPGPVFCTNRSEDDLALSEPYLLEPNTPRRITAGEGARAEALANLVRSERYWLGLSLESATLLGIGERIELTEGVIIASF